MLLSSSSLSVFQHTRPSHCPTAGAACTIPPVLLAQIEFLEVRLAEVMAYADIPVAMRPALSELCSSNVGSAAELPTVASLGVLGMQVAAAAAGMAPGIAAAAAADTHQGHMQREQNLQLLPSPEQDVLRPMSHTGILAAQGLPASADGGGGGNGNKGSDSDPRVEVMDTADPQASGGAQSDPALDAADATRSLQQVQTGDKPVGACPEAAGALTEQDGSGVAATVMPPSMACVNQQQQDAAQQELAAVKDQLMECLEDLGSRERELDEVRQLQTPPP